MAVIEGVVCVALAVASVLIPPIAPIAAVAAFGAGFFALKNYTKPYLEVFKRAPKETLKYIGRNIVKKFRTKKQNKNTDISLSRNNGLQRILLI